MVVLSAFITDSFHSVGKTQLCFAWYDFSLKFLSIRNFFKHFPRSMMSGISSMAKRVGGKALK